MRRKYWKLIALAAVVLYLLLKSWCGGGGESTVSTDELLINRIWVDHLPSDGKERAYAFVMADRQVGVISDGSLFRRQLDLVRWAQKGGDLEWTYLQDERVEKNGLKVWRCENDAPDPFELCLTLTRDGKKRSFYSRDDWEIGAVPSDAPGLVQELSRR